MPTTVVTNCPLEELDRNLCLPMFDAQEGSDAVQRPVRIWSPSIPDVVCCPARVCMLPDICASAKSLLDPINDLPTGVHQGHHDVVGNRGTSTIGNLWIYSQHLLTNQ